VKSRGRLRRFHKIALVNKQKLIFIEKSETYNNIKSWFYGSSIDHSQKQFKTYWNNITKRILL
jgi:hypothetical protein